MTSTNGHLDPHLDAYLDDTMDTAARQTFEGHLPTRPDLRERVAGQRNIDASIRRLYVPASSERLTRLVADAIEEAGKDEPIALRPRRSSMPWRGALGIAAAIVLMLGGAWMIWGVLRPPPPGTYARQAFRSMATVYDDVVDADLTPTVVCRDNEEFARWFRRPFGQALQLAETPGATALGLGYSNTISPWTIYVIVTVDDAPVIVFVDKSMHDGDPAGDLPPGLRRFRRTVGDLVLYEVTPWETARVLDRFYDPDVAIGPGT